MWNRKALRAYYDKWVHRALRIQALDDACTKLKKTEHKRRMRIWFWKFHQQAKNVKRGNNITERCSNLIRVRQTARRKAALMEWLTNARKLELAHKFIQRALNGQKRNWVQIYFKKWRNI